MKYKYGFKDIEKVKDLRNSGVSKMEAIKRVGFSGFKTYAMTLDRLGLEEITEIRKKQVTFENECSRKFTEYVTLKGGIKLTINQFNYLKFYSRNDITKRESASLSGYDVNENFSTTNVEKSINEKLNIKLSKMSRGQIKRMLDDLLVKKFSFL